MVVRSSSEWACHIYSPPSLSLLEDLNNYKIYLDSRTQPGNLRIRWKIRNWLTWHGTWESGLTQKVSYSKDSRKASEITKVEIRHLTGVDIQRATQQKETGLTGLQLHGALQETGTKGLSEKGATQHWCHKTGSSTYRTGPIHTWENQCHGRESNKHGEPSNEIEIFEKKNRNIKNVGLDMAQWLGALVVLAEGPSSIPSTYIVDHNHP